MSEDIFQLVNGHTNAASSNFVEYCVREGLVPTKGEEWVSLHYTAHAQLLRERFPEVYAVWLAQWRLGVRTGSGWGFGDDGL